MPRSRGKVSRGLIRVLIQEKKNTELSDDGISLDGTHRGKSSPKGFVTKDSKELKDAMGKKGTDSKSKGVVSKKGGRESQESQASISVSSTSKKSRKSGIEERKVEDTPSPIRRKIEEGENESQVSQESDDNAKSRRKKRSGSNSSKSSSSSSGSGHSEGSSDHDRTPVSRRARP